MPRKSRLDAPGVMHHVIIRGIERKKIFWGDADRDDFLDRLETLLPETKTACYAWALMGNHAHFLIRSGQIGLAGLMQRLLTGYVVSFNRRHYRHGQLFQNRYKSIICQEDAYLKELVRYIHLNPLRAGIVKDIGELAKFPYCGHGVLTGKMKYEWQDVDKVLRYFSERKREARKLYLSYVEAGISRGRRPELVGGGLIRSLGGWSVVKSMRKKGMDRIKGDQRILGDSDFVQLVLESANEKLDRTSELKRLGIDQDFIARRSAELYGLDPDEIFIKSRKRRRVAARDVFCFWAVRELGLSQIHIARRIRLSPAGVGYAVQRGETIVRENGFKLIDNDT